MKTNLKEAVIAKPQENWLEVKISDICDITSSKRIFLREYVKSGVPFYRSKEIILKANHNEITSPLFISEEKYREIKNKYGVPREGDILLTSVGTLGVTYCVGKNEKFYFKDGNLTWFRDYKSPINNKYLYYWLQSPQAKGQIETIAIGSTQKALTIDSLKKMVICLPKYEEQSRIVKILDDIYEKIKLNNQMNQSLEKMGQALFKHWFVDFEFPNGKDQPYKSSGGEMTKSDLGEIPKRWQVTTLKDCGKIVCGKTPPTRKKEYYNGDIPFITIPDMRGQPLIINTKKNLSKCGAETQKKQGLPPLAVCVSCIATPGLVSMTTKPSHTNQQINSVVSNDSVSPYFMYFSMCYKREEIKTLGLGGTATLNLNTSDFSRIKIIMPAKQVMKSFHHITKSLFSEILNNTKENYTLINIRDSLLPRLIAGKIRIRTK